MFAVLLNPLESLDIHKNSHRPQKLLNLEELGLKTGSAPYWHRDTAQGTCALQTQFLHGKCTRSYMLYLLPALQTHLAYYLLDILFRISW